MEDLNLERYEILPCEPLHDIVGHIKNLYEEIPVHLTSSEKAIFTNLKNATFEGKDSKRGCDYRASLVKLCFIIQGKIPTLPTEILTTLAKIQEILYSTETVHMSGKVLRLHNLTFKHATLITKYFDTGTKLGSRKVYGKYYHTVTSHASQQYRVISGRSCNTGQEERTFNFLKTASTNTSNHHPDHVILNSIIRLQIGKTDSKTYDEKGVISKLKNACSVQKSDTVYTFEWIDDHPYEYQAQLERIADFLLECDDCWTECDDGIIFHDSNKDYNKKRLHHFRSYTIKEELEYIQRCWDTLITSFKHRIPTKQVKIDNNDVAEVIKLATLNHYKKMQNATALQDQNNKYFSDTFENSFVDFAVLNPLHISTPEDLKFRKRVQVKNANMIVIIGRSTEEI